MFKKIIKLIICFVIIFAISFSAFASLSAADGSAFVTKSEFDSAVADFNSRLTTFEGGINSKIDSQVTSYLDRNGIWSGKKQDFTNTSISPFGLKFDNSKSGYYSYYDFGPAWGYTYGYADGYWGVGANYVNTTGEIVLIDKISKAGLMCLQYDKRYGANNGAASWTAVQLACWRATQIEITGDQFGLSYNTKLDIYQQRRNISGTADEGAAELLYTDSVDCVYPVPCRVENITSTDNFAFFFVARNARLYAKTTAASTFRNVGGYKAVNYISTYYYNIKGVVY